MTVTFDTVFWASLAALIVLLLLAAVAAGAATALSAAARGKLKALADKGSRGALHALRMTDDRERTIGALLLGAAVISIVATALATMLLLRLLGPTGIAVAIVGVATTLLVLADVLPKTLALTLPETVATRTALVVRPLVAVFAPIVRLAGASARGILRLFGINADHGGQMLALREEIAGAIALGHSEGAVEKDSRDRLLGALDLSHRTVDEIMRHRRQIEMVDAAQTPDEIITQVLASSHTRLPVFRGSDDNILGVVHAKDLLREVDRLVRGADSTAGIQTLDIVKVAMKPYFIPDTTSLDEQMREFLARRTHFALVVDEYGSLQGLITLEDILEEIVGEITDEFDVVLKDSHLVRSEDGSFLIDGAMTIRDLNRATDWRLPDTEANTIAGLVIHEAQMIPTEGQVFRFHGFRIEVVARRENRITRLKLRPL